MSTQPTNNPPQIGNAMAELRSLFPGEQIIISLRDCGEETTTIRGTSREYGIQIGMNGDEFDADTLEEAMKWARKKAKRK